jgi:hypothetical protein
MPDESPAKPEWTMSDERAFMENLLCTRFNFFLVFFSLIVAGGIAASDPVHFRIIFCLGAAICVPFALTIARAQAKLDIALAELLGREGHPVKILNDACPGVSMRKWIGYWIPFICCVALIIGALLALCGCLAPAVKAG